MIAVLAAVTCSCNRRGFGWAVGAAATDGKEMLPGRPMVRTVTYSSPMGCRAIWRDLTNWPLTPLTPSRLQNAQLDEASAVLPADTDCTARDEDLSEESHNRDSVRDACVASICLRVLAWTTLPKLYSTSISSVPIENGTRRLFLERVK